MKNVKSTTLVADGAWANKHWKALRFRQFNWKTDIELWNPWIQEMKEETRIINIKLSQFEKQILNNIWTFYKLLFNYFVTICFDAGWRTNI